MDPATATTRSVRASGSTDALTRTLGAGKPKPRTVAEVKAARAPGPKYILPDTVSSKQPLSTFRAPPGVAMGTAHRSGVQHFVDTPGPGSYPQYREGSISTQKAIKSFSMRGREKFGAVGVVGEVAKYPGPGAYINAKDPMKGPAPVPLLLGRLPERKNVGKQTPGPGEYKVMESVGRMPVSTKRSAPASSFGVGGRPNMNFVDKQILAAPGDYAVPESVGKQALSTRKSGRAASITGRVEVKKKTASTRTGPGMYKVKQAVGKQVESKNRSGPSFSMGGRVSFGSPY